MGGTCSCSEDSTPTTPRTTVPTQNRVQYETLGVNSFVDEETGEQEIHTATRDNNITHLKYLIENHADINAQTRDTKDTPLHIAAEINSRTAIALLIGSDADVNIKNADGKLAIELCDESLVKQFEIQTALRTMKTKYVLYNTFAHF